MELFLKNFTLPNDVEIVTLNMGKVFLKKILSKTDLSNFENINSFILQFQNKHVVKHFVLALEDETKACQVGEALIVPTTDKLFGNFQTF